MRRTLGNIVGAAMVLLLAASAAYSANFRGLRDAIPPPASRVDAGAIDRDPTTQNDGAGETSLRSFPWWTEVATFSGEGSTTTDDFSIDPFALQWRAVWTCESGELFVQARRPNGDVAGQPLADDGCPAEGDGLSVEVDDFVLDIEAKAAWEVVVEEQVDVPLVEPLTAEMQKGRVVATGRLYDMDRRGNGSVAIYRLPDGSHMLRLEDFYVTPNVDLEIDVSVAKRPLNTLEFTSQRFERVAMMPTTTGSINYEVPRSIDLKDWKSVVIWCEPLHLAYSGATLQPVR